MEDFKKIWDARVAGIDAFEYVLVDDILTWPAGAALTLNEYTIALKANKKWGQGFALDSTLAFADTPAGGSQGKLFAKNFNGFLPHDHEDTASNFYTNQYKKFILKYTDRNGVKRIIGSPTHPLQLDFEFKLSPTHTGEKGWPFRFFATTKKPAFYARLITTPQFYIEDGYLFYEGELDHAFVLTAGELTVAGPAEAQFEVTDGHLQFDFNG